MHVVATRHWVTCSSKAVLGIFFSFFGPFLLHVIYPKALFIKFVQLL